MKKQIEAARSEGYGDEEILGFLQSQYEGLQQPISQALEQRYPPNEILDFLSSAYPEPPRGSPKIQPQALQQKEQSPGGFVSGFQRGFGSGVTGIATGYGDQEAPQDEGFFEHLGSILGESLSDIPAMVAGGLGGSAAGTAVAPGLGTAIGGGAGAFALPTLIKSAYGEYLDATKSGEDLSFGEFLERAGRVGTETGKSAVIGGTVSQAAKFLPVIKRLPGMSKLLNTRVGKTLEHPIAELTTLTGAQSVVNFEVPSLQEVGDNAAVILGFQLSNKATKNLRNRVARAKTSVADVLQNLPGDQQKLNEILEKDVQKNQPLSDVEKAKNRVRFYNERIKDAEAKGDTQQLEKYKNLREQWKEKVSAEEVQQDTRKDTNSFLDNVSNMLPEKVRGKFDSLVEKASQLKKNWDDSGQFFEMLEDYVGDQQANFVESSFKWRKALAEPIEIDGKKQKLTQENLQDMLYYRQKTGNPEIKGDTFEALSDRLPKEAKDIVNGLIDDHFRMWAKRWNENPATMAKINPRDGLADIYLPGFWKEKGISYEEAERRAAQKMANQPRSVREQFKRNGPFTNQKVFETWHDAIKEAGLEPRFDNILDVMQAYDNMMIKLEANNNVVERLNQWQQENGEKVIIRSNDKEAYKEAKKQGWIPFDDAFLRRHEIGSDESGKKYDVTSAPALVRPDAAQALQGIFRKEAYKPDNAFWRNYDKLSSVLKTLRVSLSPFHYTPLSESAFGAMGLKALKGIKPLRKFFSENFWDEATKTLGDVDALKDAAKHGLMIEPSDAQTIKEGRGLINDLLETMRRKGKDTFAEGAINKTTEKFMKYQDFLFNEYHPRLKLGAYNNYIKWAMDQYAKEGKPLNEQSIKRIKKDAASAVNDQFGGQQWQTMRFMNDPKTQKWVRRLVGYPDWTISAARQAAGALSPGVKGDLARAYWVRYGAGWAVSTSIAKFITGGFYNDDETGKIKWDPRKGLKAINDKDPSKWYSFPVPDVDIKIGDVTINPGRDQAGRKLYTHFGKQALEIPRYATNTFDALFSKSNPIIQESFKQLVSGTPYEGEIFPARGKYVAGEFRPWDATRPGTVQRAISRGKEAVGAFIPFSIQAAAGKNVGTFIASGFGAVPVAKGLSLRKAEPYVYDALRKKDIKKLNQVVKTLRDNNYNEGQIKKMISKIRKQWLPNMALAEIAKEQEKSK